MIDATIEVVGEKGYAEMTVADIIKRAGVSRRAFYENFSNREDCFLRTYDSIMGESAAAFASAFGVGAASGNGETDGNGETAGNGNGDGEGHTGQDLLASVNSGIETVFKRALRRPEALRLLMVEVGTAGPKGIVRREELGGAYEALLRERLGFAPGPGPIANPVLRGVIGGLAAVLYSHVQNGRRRQLMGLVPDLVQWVTSYWPPPPELLSFVDPDPGTLPRRRDGGRAPGTLSLGAAGSSRRRRLVGGDNGVASAYVAHSQRERILDAVANLTAANGFAALTVEGIATAASVSLQAFYEHFPSKEEAFLVAYEVGHGKGLALVERAFDAQEDWPRGVRAGIEALFDYLAGEPAFAHLALVDVQAVNARATERAVRGVNAYGQMLVPGFKEAPAGNRPPPIALEAIAGGIFEICLHHALQRRIHELPLMLPRATYFALAPFIGPEAAGRVATGAGG